VLRSLILTSALGVNSHGSEARRKSTSRQIGAVIAHILRLVAGGYHAPVSVAESAPTAAAVAILRGITHRRKRAKADNRPAAHGILTEVCVWASCAMIRRVAAIGAVRSAGARGL
jgi:hypothetical protein